MECELGHKATDEATRSVDKRRAEALWMAVQAVDNEADLLLADEDGLRFADEPTSRPVC